MTTQSGIAVSWGAEHKDAHGFLITRQATIAPPEAPKCLRMKCLLRYMYNALFYVMVANYHARRVAYAERNRNKPILERYRTGEPSPKNLIMAVIANMKLACPICRRVKTKW